MTINQLNEQIQFIITNHNALVFGLYAFGALCVYLMLTKGDWLGKLLGVVLLVVAVHFLAGCTADPLGATSRTQIRADAAVAVAQADADSKARIAEANAKAIIGAEQEKARAKIATNQAWAATVPVALVVIFGGLVVLLVVNWQGRIWYKYAERGTPMLDAKQRVLLTGYAQEHGMKIKVVDQTIYLTNGQKTIKALPKFEGDH